MGTATDLPPILDRYGSHVERMVEGVGVLRDSLALLGERPVLLAYPFVGGLASLAILAAGVGAAVAVWPVAPVAVPVVLAVTYFLMAFTIVLFVAALIDQVRDYHRGIEVSLADGLRSAARHWSTLLAWTLVVSTVGVVLAIMADRKEGLRGRVLGEGIRTGWSAATFFVVPVIVFENASALSMFQKSAGRLGESWQEVLGAVLGLRVVTYVVSTLGGGVAAGLAGLGVPWPVAVLVGGPFVVAAALVDLTLQSVVKGTMYDRVTSGDGEADGADRVSFHEIVEGRPAERPPEASARSN